VTIRLGEATVVLDKVELQAPGRFGTFTAVRLTNYTADVLIVTGIDSQDPASQEYLLPLQQNVYKTDNVSKIPTIQGISLGSLSLVPTVLVEWSDEPLKDFPGTYPTAIGVGSATPDATVMTFPIPLAGTTTTLPANPFRSSITLINTSTFTSFDTWIEWSTVDANWGGNPRIPLGGVRTLKSTAVLYFRAGHDANCNGTAAFEINEESFA